MLRLARRAVLLALSLVALSGAALAADEPPEKEPGPKAVGKRYMWKAPNGLAYEYFLPKSYDPEKGITLTFLLHGSNGWKGWGLSMHKQGEFRPEDFVVSPDGTTSNGNGGFNSLQRPDDLKRFHQLHQDLKGLIKVNATYIYGLSQGSFFAHFYAGNHGDEVQGIVAHGSGLWIGSGLKKKNHHQAIAVMHGRGDPVYPYGGGAAAYDGYTDIKYPLHRLRALEIDIHWAPWGHQAQQLAWCEGMTSTDPERVLHNLEWLEKVKDSDGWFRDPVALYQVSKRVTQLEGMDGKAHARAAKTVSQIEAAAAKHVAAITAGHEKTKGKLTAGATWAAHAHYFLRDWRGVPAADAFAKDWQKTIKKQDKAGPKASKAYYGATKKQKYGDAFSAGIDAIEDAYLWFWSADAEMRANLAKWREDARASGVSKAGVKRYDSVVKPLLKAWAKGKKEYGKLNKL